MPNPIRLKQEADSGSSSSTLYIPPFDQGSGIPAQKINVKPGNISPNASSGESNSKVYPTFSVDYPILEKAEY